MQSLSEFTKSAVHKTANVVKAGVSVAKSLPHKAAQLPREVFIKTDSAQHALNDQIKKLNTYANQNRTSTRRKRSKPQASPTRRRSGSNSTPKRESRLITVRIKSAKAQLPGGGLMEKAGFHHQWVEAPGISAGMGNMRGVPGENGQTSPDLPFSRTQVVSHRGRDFKKSQIIHGVDSNALKAWTQTGRQTGPWTPLINDCNTFVREAVSSSTPQDVFFDHFQRALPGGFEGNRDPFRVPPAAPPLLNVVIYPDGTYHKAASKY